MKSTRLFLLFVLATILLLFGTHVSAQEEEIAPDYFDHDLGDQQFSIRIGGFWPMFFTGSDDGLQSSNMRLGAAGALRWNAYLTNRFSTGIELSGSLASNVNSEYLYQFNMSSANTAYPLIRYPFFFPVSLDIGAQFTRFQDSFYLGPVIKPGAGVFYTTDSEWSFGIWSHYWIVPEIYSGDGGPPASDSRVGHFLELSLTALYHF